MLFKKKKEDFIGDAISCLAYSVNEDNIYGADMCIQNERINLYTLITYGEKEEGWAKQFENGLLAFEDYLEYTLRYCKDWQDVASFLHPTMFTYKRIEDIVISAYHRFKNGIEIKESESKLYRKKMRLLLWISFLILYRDDGHFNFLTGDKLDG